MGIEEYKPIPIEEQVEAVRKRWESLRNVSDPHSLSINLIDHRNDIEVLLMAIDKKD